MKRLVMFSLFVILAVLALVSCADNGNKKTVDGSVPIGSTPSAPPTFDKLDMGGDSFVFLKSDKSNTYYADSFIVPDRVGGETVAAAVSDRNVAVGSEFNLTVSAVTAGSPSVEAEADLKSGQCSFDVIYDSGEQLSSLALDGYLYDFGSLAGVDLTKNYWVPSAADDLAIADRTYIATNYATMSSIAWADCVFFNKDIYAELGFTESLYDLVKTKEWTFDKFVGIAVAAPLDVNDDGKMTTEDRFGIFGNKSTFLVGLVRSAGIHNTVKDENGSYSLRMYDPSVVEIYSTYSKLLDGENIFIDYPFVWNSDIYLGGYLGFTSKYEATRAYTFGGGHVLFLNGTVTMTDEFAEMSDSYGILPNPLRGESQHGYYHFIDHEASMLAVPAKGENVDVTGVILEYMAYKSEELLLPAFYTEYVHCGRNTAEDVEMVNIIKSTLHYEWTSLYDLSVTESILLKMMNEGSFGTVFDRYSARATAEIRGCIDSLTRPIK